jgi:uncharacterized protein YukE
MNDPYTAHLVVTDELATAGSQVNAKAIALSTELNSLQTRLNTLIAQVGADPAWAGVTFDFYTADQIQWNTAAKDLFGETGTDGVLGQIAHILDVNYQSYIDAETTTSSSWQTRG